jgi:hypothetical protein
VVTGRNKTKLIGWHSEDPTLKPWITDRASQAGITVREYLDRLLAEHRKEVEQQETATEEHS